MTTSQMLACAIAWTAAAVAVWTLVSNRRIRRELQAEKRTFPIAGGGVVTLNRVMSDADVEAFKARWRETYGNPEAACSAYQVPATAAGSGLCARCGMYDYKHGSATEPRATSNREAQ